MSVVEKFYRDLSQFEVDIKNWEILDEGITVLWGPSGAGKSTVIHGLLGLDKQSEVVWSKQGQRISDLSPGQRRLGVVFQDPALFPHMSARQNILFPVDKSKHRHWEDDFKHLVKYLQIDSLLEQPTHQLSGGEKQRVAIARSMIYRPQVLLLDEPFSSLDERVRKDVRSMLKQVCSDFGCPALLVTHDRGDVEDLASKVSFIELGRIVRECSADEFHLKP